MWTVIEQAGERLERAKFEFENLLDQFDIKDGVRGLPASFISLKECLATWLIELHKTSTDPSEQKLFKFLVAKLDEVFDHGNEFREEMIHISPQVNPLLNEFNDGIKLIEDNSSKDTNQKIVKSVKEIAPLLEWYIKKVPCADGGPRGFSNANIVGQRGVIRHESLTIGLTTMTPNMEYPPHNHRAEEFYVVLNEGSWNQDNGGWQRKKLGEHVYNPSNVVHSTKSNETPLVTLWFHYDPDLLESFADELKDSVAEMKELRGDVDEIVDKLGKIVRDDIMVLKEKAEEARYMLKEKFSPRNSKFKELQKLAEEKGFWSKKK